MVFTGSVPPHGLIQDGLISRIMITILGDTGHRISYQRITQESGR